MIDLESLKISVQEANMSLANLQDVFTGVNMCSAKDRPPFR